MSFKVGDRVRRKQGAGPNCGVHEGDERAVARVGRDGYLGFEGERQTGSCAHDPEKYELVKSRFDELKDAYAEAASDPDPYPREWIDEEMANACLHEIATFCLGKGVAYNHDDVMQWLKETTRWRREANNFRSDASIIMQGGEPQTDLPNRTASRSVYAEVLEALKDLPALRQRCEELREIEEEQASTIELLGKKLDDALGTSGLILPSGPPSAQYKVPTVIRISGPATIEVE